MKIFYFVFILVGVIVLANLGGYETPSGGFVSSVTGNTSATTGTNVSSGSYIEDVGIQNTGSSSSFYNKLLTLLLIGGGVGIAAGVLGRSIDVNLILSTLITAFSGWLLVDLTWIYIKLMSFDVIWIKGVSTLLFIALTAGLIISLIEFWRGTD